MDLRILSYPPEAILPYARVQLNRRKCAVYFPVLAEFDPGQAIGSNTRLTVSGTRGIAMSDFAGILRLTWALLKIRWRVRRMRVNRRIDAIERRRRVVLPVAKRTF